MIVHPGKKKPQKSLALSRLSLRTGAWRSGTTGMTRSGPSIRRRRGRGAGRREALKLHRVGCSSTGSLGPGLPGQSTNIPARRTSSPTGGAGAARPSRLDRQTQGKDAGPRRPPRSGTALAPPRLGAQVEAERRERRSLGLRDAPPPPRSSRPQVRYLLLRSRRSMVPGPRSALRSGPRGCHGDGPLCGRGGAGARGSRRPRPRQGRRRAGRTGAGEREGRH